METLHKNNRKNLILVRAGDKSLHPQWLCEDRNWDLAVSYYGSFPDRFEGQYDMLHYFKGSKWEGITHFIDNSIELISKYEYIWLPDDDLFCNCENINKFFTLCKAFDFTIAQPALTPYSFYYWPIVIQDQSSIARQTNFVEIMAPCFKTKYLELFSRYFGENTSGFGYEPLWEAIAQKENIFNFGIVDATPVFHTRKMGAEGHGGAKNYPGDELRDLLEKFSLRLVEPITISRFTAE